MAVITFCGESYAVDHAVKGADYVHGYDANGVCIVAFEDVADLTAIEYDGEFMTPENCAEEVSNKVVYCGGKLMTLGGAMVCNAVTVELLPGGWANNAQTVDTEGVTAGNTVIVSPAPSAGNFEAYTENGIRCTGQATGRLTFVCESTPAGAVAVNVSIFP